MTVVGLPGALARRAGGDLLPHAGYLSARTRHLLDQAALDPDEVCRVVLTALDEDLRYGADVTSVSCIPVTASATAVVRSRAAGTLAGIPAALAVLDNVLGPDGYDARLRRRDGDRITPSDVVFQVTGNARGLLLAERTALNLLCTLSGTATRTAQWVAAVSGTHCRVRDSRKTHPGLRLLQKYAVRCGGGVNHRLGLGDAALIKDNHIAAVGSVAAAIAAVRASAGELDCEVEVTSLAELDEALAAGADTIMLDNMGPDACAEAVRRIRERAGRPALLEASGGLTLAVAAEYAATGVDYLAVGELTHSTAALDLGLDFDEPVAGGRPGEGVRP